MGGHCILTGMVRHIVAIATGTSLLLGCAGVPQPAGDELAAGSAPFVRIFSGPDREVTFTEMLDAIAEADVVFVGETHLDEVTHRVELDVYNGLCTRRDGRVVLAMEMFTTDVQPALDDYVGGRIGEAAFLERAHPWSNYHTGYRALVESARARGLPVVGSNISPDLRRTISTGGAEAWAALTPDERALVPPTLEPGTVEYWKRFHSATGGHMGGDGTASDPDPMSYLYSVQSLWDNTMGWSCARALTEHPGCAVMHLNGGFHSKYGDGTVEQLRRRSPGARVATIQIVPAFDLHAIDTRDAGQEADFVVFAEARARDVSEGFFAVTAPRELRYRLHVPKSASAETPAPLLIWLPPEGLRAADGVAFWRHALGDEAAIAVVEPPMLQREDDLHLGGLWYRTETFHTEVGSTITGLERIREYLLRHEPIDPGRVAIAGVGTGATVVIAAAVASDRLPVHAIAVQPRQTGRLAEVSPPDLAPPTLDLIIADDDSDRWTVRCAAYGGAGLKATAAPADDGAAERLVRAALGLAAPAPPPVSASGPAGSSPLLAQWARLWARRAPDEPMPPPGAVLDADRFAGGAGLPAAEGPFGGTTLLIVPASATEAQRDSWTELAASDAMQKTHGRFHRLVVAFENGEPTLRTALGRLIEQGRSNVLIVPAVFCADASTMGRLRQELGDLESRLSIAWLPGLGGSMAR